MPLYLAVALSAVLAALLVYRYDLYNREPVAMLALAAAAGAVTMHLVAGLELFTLGFFRGDVAQSGIGAFYEELSRLAVVGAIAVIFPKEFDDPMDGIIYGAVVGLGMGVEESFSLLNLMAEKNLLTLPVELVRLCGHLVMGGICGFGVGTARMRMAGWPRALGWSFAIAFALHFAWDFVALASPDGSTLSLVRTFLAIGIMLGGMLVFGSMVHLGSRLSRGMFAPGSARRLWGWPFGA
jgi:RsiW-degrading membrane proteinase PrsW (M82 family)